MEKILISHLKGKGERITQVRRVLITLLEKSHEPRSAIELQEMLKQEGLAVNKTTVYRQLETLLRHNLITEINLNDRSTRYELVRDNDHHHHLVCINCQRIVDVRLAEENARQFKTIEKKYRFTILRHSLELFGLCADCQKIAA